jgi:hypothetical protein
MVDIFLKEGDASCKRCVNERGNLTGFLFQLLSMLIPDLPIIIFPNWPDIYIDLHRIRV